jgi:hypothetical protein
MEGNHDQFFEIGDESTGDDARIEYDTDLQRDDAMLRIAEAKMLAWALDRVLG